MKFYEKEIPWVKDKCLIKVTKGVLKKFLEEKLKLTTLEATKILLLIPDKHLDSCKDIVNCYKYWDALGLRAYETYGKNTEPYFGGNKIYDNLLDIYGDKLVQAMNKNKEDIICLTYRNLEIYEKIDNLQFVLDGNKVYIRYDIRRGLDDL